MQSTPLRSSSVSARFRPEDVDTWRRDGAVVIEKFFTPAEVAAVVRDFETVFGRLGGDEPLIRKKEGETGRFHEAQFKGVAPVPLDCSPALNLIGVHPALVAFAKEALGAPDVHVYQCQAWAKYTGEADYDQPFHCDFVNHTLTAPSEVTTANSITILCYFSDVSEAHGPMHYVPRTASASVAGPEATFSLDSEVRRRVQEGLQPLERSSAAPAGSIVPYAIDVYHRGTNLTAPHGHRFALMSCFKKAGDEAIAFHAWAFHHMKPWARIFDHATPEQLACFGVPRPGHPFWTDTTIKRTEARYPGWNSKPYRGAMG